MNGNEPISIKRSHLEALLAVAEMAEKTLPIVPLLDPSREVAISESLASVALVISMTKESLS